MTRCQAWTFILLGALTVGLSYSLDQGWQLERDQRIQLARIWDAELEVQELRSQFASLREPEDDPERDERGWGTGSMCVDPAVWDSHLVDLRRDEPYPVLVLNSHFSICTLSAAR